MSRPRILFILTSADKLPDGTPTGWFLPEAANPYVHLSPHVDIDWASPKGGAPPLDPAGIKHARKHLDEESRLLMEDEKAKGNEKQSGYEHTMKLSEVDKNKYEAVFYVGGHGPVVDLARDQDSINLAAHMYQNGKVVAAVCHGPGALVEVKDKNGASIFAGNKATAFSNQEEHEVGLADKVPFLVEDKIKELGGQYVKADKPWFDCVERSKKGEKGTLITGQNPASARSMGRVILAELLPQYAKTTQPRTTM